MIYCINFVPLSSSSCSFPAPDPPTGLQVSQNGQSSVLVSWTPASGDTTHSYTIIAAPLQGGLPVQAVVDATETNATVTGLMEATYSVTVVANSNTLSSNSTEPEIITLGIICMNDSAILSSKVYANA